MACVVLQRFYVVAGYMPLQRIYAVSNLLVIYGMFSAGVKSLLIARFWWKLLAQCCEATGAWQRMSAVICIFDL
jgi:hypothetical protein